MARGKSRAKRCAEACDAIREVATALRGAVERAEELLEQVPEPGDTITLSEDEFKDLPLDADVSEIESLQEEMQSWFDNMPESLQGGDKGQTIAQSADALSSANDTLQAVQFPLVPNGEVTREQLETFKEELETAADELESSADEAEGAEFPGMYG